MSLILPEFRQKMELVTGPPNNEMISLGRSVTRQRVP